MMEKRKANISFVVLVALLTVCCGASLIAVSSSSKFNARTEYERIKNRTIAESALDIAVGLFVNYLGNQDYVLAYTQNEGGSYSVMSDYSPYLLTEIRADSLSEDVEIEIIQNETKDYLTSIGYVDFRRNGEVRLSVNTFGLSDQFKLSEMCISPHFLLSTGITNEESELKPINISVKVTYNGGEVMANVKISGLKAVRNLFTETGIGEIASVTAWLDTSDIDVKYINYQNYGGGEI